MLASRAMNNPGQDGRRMNMKLRLERLSVIMGVGLLAPKQANHFSPRERDSRGAQATKSLPVDRHGGQLAGIRLCLFHRHLGPVVGGLCEPGHPYLGVMTRPQQRSGRNGL